MCQDDYCNVDNSRWGFETACDQHSADKALHNDRDYSLDKCYVSEAACAARCSGDRPFICSGCSSISAVWLFALNTVMRHVKMDLMQMK